MVVAVLFIFLGLNLGILGPGVDDSDGDKHVENKLVWNFNSNGKFSFYMEIQKSV